MQVCAWKMAATVALSFTTESIFRGCVDYPSLISIIQSWWVTGAQAVKNAGKKIKSIQFCDFTRILCIKRSVCRIARHLLTKKWGGGGGGDQSFLPQVKPSPSNPSLHEHWNDPIVFAHVALTSHTRLSPAHSSTSLHACPLPTNPGKHSQ